jgi:hypothetical protein
MSSESINDGTPQMETPTVPCNAELVEGIREGITPLMVALDAAEKHRPDCRVNLEIVAEDTTGNHYHLFRLEHAQLLKDVARLVGYENPTDPEKRRILADLGIQTGESH